MAAVSAWPAAPRFAGMSDYVLEHHLEGEGDRLALMSRLLVEDVSLEAPAGEPAHPLHAPLEPLLEPGLILRNLLGRLSPGKRGEQLADAVALEVELEAHA